VSVKDVDEDLKRLKFENGNIIPNVESYFELLVILKKILKNIYFI
jgi:hypothetical protein